MLIHRKPCSSILLIFLVLAVNDYGPRVEPRANEALKARYEKLMEKLKNEKDQPELSEGKNINRDKKHKEVHFQHMMSSVEGECCNPGGCPSFLMLKMMGSWKL